MIARHLLALLPLVAALPLGGTTARKGLDARVIDARVVALGAGADYTCALTNAGSVWCWGRNDAGQLGRGTSDTASHPTPARVALDIRVRSLSVGYDHACATAADGSAYCWGDDRRFESGGTMGSATCRALTLDVACRPRPVKVMAPVAFRFVAAGYRESCGIARANGHLYCWGDAHQPIDRRDSAYVDTCGEASARYACRRRPRLVPIIISEPQVRPPVLAQFDSLALGIHRSCGVMNPGRLYCWGREAAVLPRQALAVGNVVVSASIGFEHTCAVRGDGTIACYGPRTLGALALGTATGALHGPRVQWWEVNDVPSIRDARAIDGGRLYDAVAAGALHTCAIERGRGAAWCWGTNQFGQLGVGSVDQADGAVRGANPSPLRVSGAARFRAIASGLEHVCALTTTNDVRCWGRNLRGAAGSAATGVITSPRTVAGFASAQ